ncbi:transporter substrate-binding domain-containing protein, partial [Aerococcus sp. UMB8623]
ELKLELTDIPSVLTGVNTGNYDIGVNNFSYNEERAQNYLYSYPYNNAKYCFIHHKDNKIESLDQAAQAGLTYIGDPSTNNTAAV